MITFADLPLLPSIKKALDKLGFANPTEIQEKIMPTLLENYKQDVHAQAQTGTGKTFAFGIPLLHAVDPSKKEVQALVIAPTRELVLQIVESLKDLTYGSGIYIAPVFGGMPIQKQISDIRQGAQIVVGTPGRLNDHLDRKTLSLNTLKVFVLDEADIMLDMGFKQEIDIILGYAPENRAIWLFSATVGLGIKQLIKSHMNNVISVRIAQSNGVNAAVKQYFCVMPLRNRMEAAARFIQADPEFYGIIFCRTKTLTNEIMEQLAAKGFRANCLHGDMKQAMRNKVIKDFKNKEFKILVATDVAGRGIDVSDLTHVINFSIPDENESYVHRIGRTGRAGKEGVAILFVSPSEMRRMKRLEQSTGIMLEEIKVPSVDTIIASKMGAVTDFMGFAKQSPGVVPSVNKALKELLESFSKDDLKNSLALALENRFFKGASFDELAPVSFEREPSGDDRRRSSSGNYGRRSSSSSSYRGRSGSGSRGDNRSSNSSSRRPGFGYSDRRSSGNNYSGSSSSTGMRPRADRSRNG